MEVELYIFELFKPNQRRYRRKFLHACAMRDKTKFGPEKNRWQEVVEYYYEAAHSAGYFQDTFADYGLLNFIRSNTSFKDLAWTSLRAREDWFDASGNQNCVGVREFIGILEDAWGELRGRTRFYLRTHDPKREVRFPNPLRLGEIDNYKQWLGELHGFLHTSLDTGYSVYWSV